MRNQAEVECTAPCPRDALECKIPTTQPPTQSPPTLMDERSDLVLNANPSPILAHTLGSQPPQTTQISYQPPPPSRPTTLKCPSLTHLFFVPSCYHLSTVLVNVGYFLECFSNGLFPATPHRVVGSYGVP